MEETEVELIDYLRTIWGKKWIIVLVTIFFCVVSALISKVAKTIYEVDAIIQPGKFIIENQGGHLEEVIVEKPQQIANKVNHESYMALSALELQIDERDMPEIKAENIRDTLLTRMWLRVHDVEVGKKILDTLIIYIKEEIDRKVDIEINNVDSHIKQNEIDMERRGFEIEILKKKSKIIEQRKKDITNEMNSVKSKISELEKEQMKILRKEDKSETESLAMLLYSNEIQQSLRYYDILNEKLSRERLIEEDVKSDIQDEMAAITSLANIIANLKERKGRIDYTKIVKKPTSSINPVFPNTGLNIVIGLVLGFFISVFFVFLLDYIQSKSAD